MGELRVTRQSRLAFAIRFAISTSAWSDSEKLLTSP
jgi:hypothetical protein